MKKIIPIVSILSFAPSICFVGCSNNMKKIEFKESPTIKDTSFLISWNLLSDFDFFVYDVATDENFTNFVEQNKTTNSPSALVSNLTPFTTYYFRVKYLLNDKASEYSSTSIITKLIKPNGLTFTSSKATETHLEATWNKDSNAKGYKVDLATNAQFTEFVQNYNDFDAGNVNKILFDNLSPGQDYYIRVRSYANGITSESSQASYSRTIPDKPRLENISVDSSSSFSFSWYQTKGATKYFVDVSKYSDFSICVAGYENKEITGSLECSVIGLQPATKYYYHVKAGNDSGISQPSSYGEVTTLSSNPQLPDFDDCKFGEIRTAKLTNLTKSMSIICSNESCQLSYDDNGNFSFSNGCITNNPIQVNQDVTVSIIDKNKNVLSQKNIKCDLAFIKFEINSATLSAPNVVVNFKINFSIENESKFYLKAKLPSWFSDGVKWKKVSDQSISYFLLENSPEYTDSRISDWPTGYMSEYKTQDICITIKDENSNIVSIHTIPDVLTSRIY